MTTFLTRIWNDDNGQDMAEYAIMLGVIAVIVVTAATALSGGISAALDKVTALL